MALQTLQTTVKKELAFSLSPAAIPALSTTPAQASTTTTSGQVTPPTNPVDKFIVAAFASAVGTAQSPNIKAIGTKFAAVIKQIQSGNFSGAGDLLKELKSLNIDPTAIQNLFTDKAALSADSQSLALNFLNAAFLKIDPSINSQISNLQAALGPQGSQGLSDLGTRLTAVLSATEDAKKELINYLAQLYGVEVEILKENSRHHEALNNVAVLELTRWQTLQTVGNDVLGYFPDNDANGKTPANLFVVSGNSPFSGIKFTPMNVATTDLVLPSIRSLSLEVGNIRKNATTTADQVNYYAAIHRVAIADRLLAGYLLLDSLNDQYSSDDALRLETELREHSLLLDGIEAELKEAEYGHTLNQLLAYHSGGLTANDFSAVAQDAALVFIAVQTNRIAK
jgi:hypothetical protein